MPALASVATCMHRRAAFGARLFPSLWSRFFDFRFGDFRRTKLVNARLVRLLHCTLRMDATGRIGCFAADGAKISWRWRNHDDGLFAAHIAPMAKVCSAVPSDSLAMRRRRPHRLGLQNPIVRISRSYKTVLDEGQRQPKLFLGQCERDQFADPRNSSAKSKRPGRTPTERKLRSRRQNYLRSV